MNNRFVRITLNLINLLISLNGLGLIALGILLILVYMRDYFYISGFIYSLSVGYIVFGVSMFSLAIVGSVSVIKKHFVLEGISRALGFFLIQDSFHLNLSEFGVFLEKFLWKINFKSIDFFRIIRYLRQKVAI